eukprot:CAMPEP_0197036210 /NCGR_PEP_ID=MMETSP1384-20130603/13790_1 /TAXON_ID=29189 /ORGANISM="Ammonia sp." /LENGTH=434 /DNA_ID=CAMNT_0042466369 /DNA_START=1002 /DNA_END=2306 /DNA_ORIENTATION=-
MIEYVELDSSVYAILICVSFVVTLFHVACSPLLYRSDDKKVDEDVPAELIPDCSASAINIEDRNRIDSISGPSKGSAHYTAFLVTLTVMIVCGSCNDFLGKLVYQMSPVSHHDLHGIAALGKEYWITYMLTFGSFAICSVAIFTENAQKSYDKLTPLLFAKIAIPSIMDFFVTGGRYLGLVFLASAVVSIMKNGLQLLFLALLRRCCHRKILGWPQVIGIMVILAGLLMVASENLMMAIDPHANDDPHTAYSFKDQTIGIVIMVSVGFAGAVRNDVEEMMLKKHDLDSDFVVGMESLISLFFTAIMGIYLFLGDPLEDIGDRNAAVHHVYSVYFSNVALLVCFLLFLIAIYGKDIMQMKMTALSSSLTRKLFQQIYPSGTWIISIIAFCINDEYGEGWEGKYSCIRLAGFALVLFGNYFYIKGFTMLKALCSKK